MVFVFVLGYLFVFFCLPLFCILSLEVNNNITFRWCLSNLSHFPLLNPSSSSLPQCLLSLVILHSNQFLVIFSYFLLKEVSLWLATEKNSFSPCNVTKPNLACQVSKSMSNLPSRVGKWLKFHFNVCYSYGFDTDYHIKTTHHIQSFPSVTVSLLRNRSHQFLKCFLNLSSAFNFFLTFPQQCGRVKQRNVICGFSFLCYLSERKNLTINIYHSILFQDKQYHGKYRKEKRNIKQKKDRKRNRNIVKIISTLFHLLFKQKRKVESTWIQSSHVMQISNIIQLFKVRTFSKNRHT